MNIKNRNFNNIRFWTSIIICTLPFFVFTARLVDWQIINTEQYRKRAQNNSSYVIKTDAMRGEILDRDGEGIVINSTGYRVVIDKVELEKDRENYVIAKSISLLTKLKVPWRDMLPISFENDSYIFMEGKDSQISSLKKYLKLGNDAPA